MKKLRLCLSDIYIAVQHKMKDFLDDLIFPFRDLSSSDYFVIGLFFILEIAFCAFIVSLILGKL